MRIVLLAVGVALAIMLAANLDPFSSSACFWVFFGVGFLSVAGSGMRRRRRKG